MRKTLQYVVVLVILLTLNTQAFGIEITRHTLSKNAQTTFPHGGFSIVPDFKAGVMPGSSDYYFDLKTDVSPFYAFSKDDRIGFTLSFAPDKRKSFLFFDTRGASIRIGCTDSALQVAEKACRGSSFKKKPTYQFKAYQSNTYSYPCLSKGSCLFIDNYIKSRYLAPKVYFATPKVANCLDVKLSYCPFVVPDNRTKILCANKSIEDGFDEYCRQLDSAMSPALDQSVRIKNIKQNFGVNAKHSFSIAPSLHFAVRDGSSLDIVFGLESAQEELTMFYPQSGSHDNNGTSFHATNANAIARKHEGATLVTTYIGARMDMKNTALVLDWSALHEMNVPSSTKDMSWAVTATAKYSIPKHKLDMLVSLEYAKQMQHYFDKNIYQGKQDDSSVAGNNGLQQQMKFLDSVDRSKTYMLNYLMGVHYKPIKEVIFYIEGGILSAEKVKQGKQLDVEAPKLGLSIGVATKL